MNISFNPLEDKDFPLLLKWLQSPHVRAGWDDNLDWTPELIAEKYSSYVGGYKHNPAGDPKPIKACIIQCDDKPVGYIQGYNAYDFEDGTALEQEQLPSSLVAFDIYIGETDYLRKGIASKAIALFFDQFFAMFFDYAFAAPQAHNIAAIRVYEHAGFKKTKEKHAHVWMVKGLR